MRLLIAAVARIRVPAAELKFSEHADLTDANAEKNDPD